jgi:hypothetical protein
MRLICNTFHCSRPLAAGIGVSRIEFPKGMDANEYALKVQPASRSLSVLVRAATWIGAAPRAAQVADVVAESRPEAAKEKITPPTEPTLPLAADPSPVESSGEDIVLRFGDRRYRVRGLQKNTSFDSLRVNVLVTREDLPDKFFVDTFDLYSARQRTMFEKQAAADIGLKEEVLHREMGQLLRALEQMQEEQIKRALEPKTKTPAMADAEQSSAMALLRDPNLVQRILTDFAACGVVGEETNKLMGYLAAVSRKLEQPLAIVVQSSSAAGKSALMEAVLSFMPEEERVQYSAMTGQSLFYMGETDLKHKNRGWRRARQIRSETPSVRRTADDRVDRQRSAHRQARHARVPRRRTGDDLPHDNRDRDRRRASQSLHRAHRRRGPRADARDPPAAA